MKKLSKDEMKKVMGGLNAPIPTCSASASCGSNGNISCTGYKNSSGAGCTATDGIGVACPDQSGIMQLYKCPAN